MNVTHETLYDELNHILKKNIDTQKSYLKASTVAKHPDIKLFFKNKVYNTGLFNKKLMSELNIEADAFMYDVNEPEYQSKLSRSCDEVLLLESLKIDRQTLIDFESSLKNPNLPFSIRLILKEQIIFIRLDEVKREQLICLCK